MAARRVLLERMPRIRSESRTDDERPRRWRWRDYLFTIDAHAYDAWMQLSIARLELEPVPR